MSNTIFEIFNKDGDVIRRGPVGDEGLNIDIRDDDYRYVVRDKDDPRLIYNQGYIQKTEKQKSSSQFPVVLVKEENGKTILHCNTFKEGHRTLYFYPVNRAEKRTEIVLTKPVAEVSLEAGRYVFYTEKEDDASALVEFTIVAENNLSLLKKAGDNIENITESHKVIMSEVENLLLENDHYSIYSAAQHVYLETPKEDTELLIAAYDILHQIEKIINERNQLNNEKSFEVSHIENAPQEFIRVGPSITKATVYQILNGKSLFMYTIDTSLNKEQIVSMKNDCLHRIELYAGKDLVSFFYIFSPDQSVKEAIWNRHSKSIRKTDESKERKFLLFNNHPTLKDEEKELLVIESLKKPLYDIVSAPEARYADEELEVFINEFELLRRLEREIYLCIKEVPYVFYPNRINRIPIHESVLNIDLFECRFFPEKKYFIWIEDGSGNILSALRMVSTDNELAEQYNSVSREAGIQIYEERVANYVHLQYEGIHELLKDEVGQLLSIEEVNPQNIYKILIAKLSKSKNAKLYNSIAAMILEDKFNRVLVDEQFFAGPAVLYRESNRIVFPKRYYEYIIQTDSFNVGDTETKTRYYNIKEDGIVDLGDDDYFIISAIDKRTYARSGFLFLNTFKHDTILSNWKIGIEVK